MDKNTSKIIKIIANISILAVICYLVYTLLRQAGGLAIFDSQKLNEIAEERSYFDDFLEKNSKLSKSEKLSCFIAVGDIMPARGVNQKFQSKGCGYIFKGVADYFKQKNILIVSNFESSLSTSTCPNALPDTMSFCAPASFTNCLIKPNGNTTLKVLASLANNHTMNYGVNGLKQTLESLKSFDVLYAGAGNNIAEANNPVIIEQDSKKFGFLAYADRNILSIDYDATENRAGVNPMDYDLLAQGIKKAKEQADFVIILMHSGEEYVATANQKQIDFAHKAIDLGADLVIGHHPHVVQNAEIYNGKYIFYSLGNFIFDQMWSYDTRNGLMTEFCFDSSGVKNIQLLPIEIKDYSQPNIIFGENARKTIDRLKIETKKTEILQFDGTGFTTTTNFRIGDREKSRAREYQDYYFDTEHYFNLKNGTAEALDGNKTIFKTDAGWFVDDLKFAKLDSDKNDIVFSLWKSGSYGNQMPSWEKENDTTVKNHIFVYRFVDGKFEPKWQSSNLPNPNCEIEFADINEDGFDELIAIEGEYNDDFVCDGKRYAVLKWNGWGFEKIWQSGEGEYNNLRTMMIGGKMMVFVDKKINQKSNIKNQNDGRTLK